MSKNVSPTIPCPKHHIVVGHWSYPLFYEQNEGRQWPRGWAMIVVAKKTSTLNFLRILHCNNHADRKWLLLIRKVFELFSGTKYKVSCSQTTRRDDRCPFFRCFFPFLSLLNIESRCANNWRILWNISQPPKGISRRCDFPPMRAEGPSSSTNSKRPDANRLVQGLGEICNWCKWSVFEEVRVKYIECSHKGFSHHSRKRRDVY